MILNQKKINSLIKELTELTENHQRFLTVYDKVIQINCTLEFPLGEVASTKTGGFMWAWDLQNMLNNIQPIEKPDRFNAQGLEGKIVIESLPIVTALLFARASTVGRYQIKVDKKDLIKVSEFLKKDITQI